MTRVRAGVLGGSLLALCMIASVPGCGDDVTALSPPNLAACGNGVVDEGEICDGDALGDASCADFGHTGGTLSCNATCDGLVADACSTCGDGDITGLEECDGDNLAATRCENHPDAFEGGTLACDPATCAFDTSACHRCGDGIKDTFEECDGDDFGELTCETLATGYEGGILKCNLASCTVSASACSPCGNGVLDAGEACDDGDAIDGNDCTNDCKVPTCGDGVVWNQGSGQEGCDDGALNSDTLADACRTDCTVPSCGDGVVDSAETCDPESGDPCCDEACGFVEHGQADPTGVCLAQGPMLCDGEGGCLEIPEELLEPTPQPDGLPSPLPGVYDDLGPTDPDEPFRALLGFPIRNEPALHERVRRMYDPGDPEFRKYMTPAELLASHAPFKADFDLVKAWLVSEGFSVNFEAKNRTLLQFSGTAGQFNASFGTTMHTFMRKNPQQGNPPFPVFGTDESALDVPTYVDQRITGVVTADLPADTKPLPNEIGEIEVSPPNEALGLVPSHLVRAYGVKPLHDAGFRGAGMKIGVSAGATFKFIDLQSFWQSVGITRDNPTVIETMEPVATRYIETNLDTAYAGALAPEAELIVYEGPDARNTSMVYTWNEAIWRNEVSVLTTSFAHREDSEPKLVRHHYSDSSLFGAAMGITLVAASGDSSAPDTPSSSPYVTAVGGTALVTDASGNFLSEGTYNNSGSGVTRTFDLPYWQEGIVFDSDGRRAVVDVALSAALTKPYWVYYLGTWARYGGTSFSSPVFAGIVAVMNQYRAEQGLPRMGFLNPILYQDTAVQATFRDIVTGGSQVYSSGPGWDYPTGWGAPIANDLVMIFP